MHRQPGNEKRGGGCRKRSGVKHITYCYATMLLFGGLVVGLMFREECEEFSRNCELELDGKVNRSEYGLWGVVNSLDKAALV